MTDLFPIIDEGLPPSMSPTRGKVFNTLAALEVGQSFICPFNLWYASLVQAFTRTKAGEGKKFACRRVEGGYRIYRLK